MTEKRIELKKREVGESIENLEAFLEQNIGKVFGVIDSVRHAHTNYSETYPDITPEGEQTANVTSDQIVSETGRLTEIAHSQDMADFKQHVMFVSSPKARARATNRIIEQKFRNNNIKGVEIVDIGARPEKFTDKGVVRTMRSLDAMKMHDFPQAIMLLVTIAAGDWSPRKADYIHVHSEEYETRPDLWEKRSDVQRRSLGALAHATNILNRYHAESGTVPRVVATSHFEVLNHLLMDVFSLSDREEDDAVLKRAEKFTIYLLKPENDREVPMVINYRDQSKRVTFNKQSRKFD